MQTSQQAVQSDAVLCDFTWTDKLALAACGILDAVTNCSLDSFQRLFCAELQNPADRPSDDLARLRAVNDRFQRISSARNEALPVAKKNTNLGDRLDPLVRRQSRCLWRAQVLARANARAVKKDKPGPQRTSR